MTARFDEASAVAGAAGQTAARLGLRPIEAASQMLLGLIAGYQGRRRDMDRRLAAAEALAPDDADLRAGAWGLGRGMLALLEEDRPGGNPRVRQGPRRGTRPACPHPQPLPGPGIAAPGAGRPGDSLRGGAGRRVGSARGALAAAVGRHHACHRPRRRRRPARCRPGAGGGLEAGDRYPIFRAIAQRLAGEAALRDKWGDPVALLRSADATLTRFGVRSAAAACQGLLRAAGQRAPRRRSGDASLRPDCSGPG